MTKSYALASAYAELYERFCNRAFIYDNYLLIRILLEQHYNKYGYYVDKNEIIPSSIIEELNDNNIYNFYYTVCDNNIDLVNNIINFPINNNKFSVPYKGVFEDKIKYYNPLLLIRHQGSNGMVAGNTFDEALNQGISELLERNALITLLKNKDNILLYQLDESIFPDNLKQIADNIKNDNNKLFIFDLSYLTNTPVLMGIIINSETKTITTNLGCFPVFDIALERIFTELYQNRESYSKLNNTLRIPGKDYEFNNYIAQVRKGTNQDIFPEYILNNIKNIKDYNKQVFLEKNKNNNEILEYYKILFNKLNYELYYYNNSLDDNMVALSLFSPQLSVYRSTDGLLGDTEKKFSAIKHIKKFYDSLYSYIIANSIEPFLFYSYGAYEDQTLYKYISHFSYNSNMLFPFERPEVEQRDDINRICYAIMFNKLNLIMTDEDLYRITKDRYNSKAVLKYMTLLRYIGSNKYTFEELQNLFNYFSDSITKEDYEKIYTPTYLFSKTFLEPFKQTYSINNLTAILRPYVEKEYNNLK